MTWRPAFWLVAAAVVTIDQATKIWALATLVPYEKHQILGEWLQIQLVFNSGAAFSLGADFTWIVTLVMLAITAGIIWYARRAQSRLAVVLFGLGLGGAVGNLIDRLFRDPGFMHGHVVDMINYNNWFVGNVADIAIVGVAVAMLLVTLSGRPVLAPTDGDSSDDSAAPEVGDVDAHAATASAGAPERSAPSPATPEQGTARG